jgi:hypothetical protein
MIASDLQMKSIRQDTLILTFSHGEKELPRALELPLVGRDSVEPNECPHNGRGSTESRPTRKLVGTTPLPPEEG